MLENYNILELFEKVQELERKYSVAIARIEVLEGGKQKELITGYYTVDEICIKYEFSRKTFFNYKKIVPLQKSQKTGLKDKYKKTEVEQWYNLVLQKKDSDPELFTPEFVKRTELKKAS
jgi:hypothetical protein